MRAIIYLSTATFFWGLNFYLAIIMLQSTHFLEAGFWRYFFGVLVLLGLSYQDLPSLRSIKIHQKGLYLVGVVGLFGFNLFFFLGMNFTSAVNAALIVSLNPALTLLFSSWILKTELKRQHIWGLLLALLGAVYLLAKGHIATLLQIQFSTGDILIFIANAVFALHHVWVKKYAVHIPNRHFTLLTNVLCFLCFMLCLPFISMGNVSAYPSDFWLAALGMGAFGTALAYIFWNSGVQKVGANQAGIFMNVVPLSTGVLAIFFGESLYFYHLVSAFLILGGVAVMRSRN